MLCLNLYMVSTPSIHCWSSNSQLLNHETPTITTRSGLAYLNYQRTLTIRNGSSTVPPVSSLAWCNWTNQKMFCKLNALKQLKLNQSNWRQVFHTVLDIFTYVKCSLLSPLKPILLLLVHGIRTAKKLASPVPHNLSIFHQLPLKGIHENYF